MPTKKQKKIEKKITVMEATDIMGMSSRKKFVIKELFDLKDTKTLSEWTTCFKSKRVLD